MDLEGGHWCFSFQRAEGLQSCDLVLILFDLPRPGWFQTLSGLLEATSCGISLPAGIDSFFLPCALCLKMRVE